jgi:hypothetical protein
VCVCVCVCVCLCLCLCLSVCAVCVCVYVCELLFSTHAFWCWKGHKAAFTSAWPASCFGVRRVTTRLLTVFSSTSTMLAYTDYSNCSSQVGKCVCVWKAASRLGWLCLPRVVEWR